MNHVANLNQRRDSFSSRLFRRQMFYEAARGARTGDPAAAKFVFFLLIATLAMAVIGEITSGR